LVRTISYRDENKIEFSMKYTVNIIN
jgi:hypothetical protein